MQNEQNPAKPIPSPRSDWLTGGGEMSALIRAKDWSLTPLGAIETWPQSLRTTVSLCLASNFPINIIWGPEATQIYNLGFKTICGSLHPRSVGESYRISWESAWPTIGEPFERALKGQTTFLENQRMFICRNGYLEETFFTFSLSPIRDEAGEVVGLFNPVTETTSAMLNHRRTRLLRDITCESANSDDVPEAAQRIVRTLADYKADIPLAAIFLEKDPGTFAVAACSDDDCEIADPARWPIADALATAQPYYVNDMVERFGSLANTDYVEPIQHGCLLPIIVPSSTKPIGFFAVTLSSRLPHNEAYMAFLDMLNNAVGAAIANARMNENTLLELNEFQTDIRDLQVIRHSQEAAAQILLESKDAAEAATRAKSAFLANMSHEIRTPLSAILGFTEILKSHKTNLTEREKYLNIISRNGNSLIRIIDDILDLSKIEAGKFQLEQEPLCLTELIEDVMVMFSDRAVGKGLTLSFDPTGLPDFLIQSDAVRIRQILVNLLGNAIKFTTEGGITVGGKYKMLPDGQWEITLSVADTGIGISPQQAANLFQAFTQADNKTTRHFGGTGLGLALSKKLAKAMGGDVSIASSSLAIGTTFLVKLIGRKAVQSVDYSTAAPAPMEKGLSKRLHGWSILVVDDAEDNRMLMRILMEREGAVIQEAASGEEGIRKALATDFDVVLMDIQMPALDGYEALAKLRSQNYKKPIFALTAHTMKEEKDRALMAGFSGHISKPVNPTVVVETLLAHARKLH
jgi:signal transduction histidine kinase